MRKVETPEQQVAPRFEDNLFLINVIDVILTPGFFGSDGEMQTCTGFDRREYGQLRSIISDYSRKFELGNEERSMLLAALNNISGYPHGLDDLVRSELQLGDDFHRWYGSLFERLLEFMPGYKD